MWIYLPLVEMLWQEKRDKRDILLYYAQEAEEVKINLLTFSRDEGHDAEDVKINLLA